VGGATRRARPRRTEAQLAKNRQAPRARGQLGRGLATALVLHLHLLAPLLIATFIYAAREEAQRAEEVDVGFENVPAEELPRDLPPLDDTPSPPDNPSRKIVKADRRDRTQDQKQDKKKRQEPPKPETKLARETPPEPEVPVPPLPPMPEPPKATPPPPPPKLHEKIVDLDNDKDVPPPPDAKYLAQKNNRADVETRATQTNMEREQKGGEGSQQPTGERRDDPQIGDDRAHIAQLEEEKSRLGRKAPEVTPSREAEALERLDEQPPAPQKSPVLSLRDATPRGHEMTPETVDPSLPHDPAGMLAQPSPHGAFHDEDMDHPLTGSKRPKLALSGKDYEYLFGREAKAERQLMEKERSTRLGKYARGAARVRSALENFITEVKPGNQTALNTRAAPFAAFIARMHRNIHQLWGFGALENWDELPASSPLNDESLMSTLEIELNRDGTVSKVTMVHASKYLPFDAAAIDVVLNAAPYPEPPREIRSGNGKIYVHWSFYRDGHQCATSGVDYFILDNAPKGGDLSSSGSGEGEGDDPVTTGVKAPSRRASSSAAPAAMPEVREPGPRRLERKMGQVDERRLVAESLPGAEGPSRVPAPAPAAASSSRAGAAGPADAQDKATQELARAWFSAFVRGDVGAMTSRSTFPFRSAAGVAAKNRAELAQMLTNLVAETSVRRSWPVSVETAAGLRKLIGKLPPGLDDGSGTLFAVTRVDSDTVILLLSQTSTGWKATGLIRR